MVSVQGQVMNGMLSFYYYFYFLHSVLEFGKEGPHPTHSNPSERFYVSKGLKIFRNYVVLSIFCSAASTWHVQIVHNKLAIELRMKPHFSHCQKGRISYFLFIHHFLPSYWFCPNSRHTDRIGLFFIFYFQIAYW